MEFYVLVNIIMILLVFVVLILFFNSKFNVLIEKMGEIHISKSAMNERIKGNSEKILKLENKFDSLEKKLHFIDNQATQASTASMFTKKN